MLKLIKINAGYDDLKVLFDISLEVSEGEVVALVGSNGAGKTTLLRTISNIVSVTSGQIKWFDQDITNTPAHERPALGIAHILQGRGIVSGMSVRQFDIGLIYLPQQGETSGVNGKNIGNLSCTQE